MCVSKSKDSKGVLSQMSVENWKIEGIPAYTRGETDEKLVVLGGGLNEGFAKALEDESLMQIVRRTSELDFIAYCKELESAGFVCDYSNDEPFGLFREFVADGKLVYAYFMKRAGEARIILDRSSCSYAEFVGINSDPDTREDTELMQYGLYYADPIKGIASTCGMLYVIRTRNNKLFLVDGGEGAQCTNESFNELIRLLREMTGTTEGEQLTINCWFSTHPHNDHMDYFVNFMRKYHDFVKVERILFNFPRPENMDIPAEMLDRYVNKYLNGVMGELRTYCPDAKYMKAHTGQKFDLGGGLVAQVLQTHEDLAYDHPEGKYIAGTNTTSSLLKLTFEDKSLIILGDCEEDNGRILRKYYLPEEVECYYLQAAHHLANKIENIYSYIKADTVLIPQGRMRIHRIRREHYGILCKYYDRDKFHLEGDYTVHFRVAQGGEEEITYFPVAGGPFCPARDIDNLWLVRHEFE